MGWFKGIGAGADRRRLGWAAALFGAALLVRLAHVATIVDSPFFSRLGLDPLAYDTWGLRIASGEWLGDRIFYQDPLYPYFLGVVYAIFGHDYVVVTVLQAVLGSLVPVMVFLAAERWLGRAPALASGWIAVLYAPSVYYEGLILKSWLEAFLMAAALAALSRALERRESGAAWGLVGALLGLGCLVRANFLLLIPALGAWLLLDRTALGGTRRVRPLLALAAGAALVLGATAARNRVVGGEWVLTTSQGGQNFYLGNNPVNRNGEYEPLPFVAANPKYEERDFALEAERRTGRAMRPTEVSRFWFREAFAWIGEHPGDWLRLTVKKARVYLSAYEVPDNLDYYLYLESAPVLRLPLLGFGIVAPLGLVGACLVARRGGWSRALLVVLVVYSASVVMFFVFARYRLAMMPVLFPLAGVAIVEAAVRAAAAFRGKAARGPALVLAAGILAALAVVNLPVRAPTGYWTHRLASAVGLPTTGETTATAHFNLGVAYAKEAQRAEDAADLLRRAEAELREALRQERRYAKVYVELGKVLARQGRDAEAIEVYEASLAVQPGDWRVHHSLGLLYARNGRRDEAAEAFRSALRIDPGNAAARRGLEGVETRP